MFNSKNLIKSASVGFVLSFLISIIASGRVTVALFRGLVFGVIFALLAFAVELVYRKFLDVGGGAEPSVVAEPVSKSSKRGSFVNITIDDENLTEDDNGPNFNVEKTVGSSAEAFKRSPVVSEPLSSQPSNEPAASPAAPVADSGEVFSSAAPAAVSEKVEEAPKNLTPAQAAAAKKAAKRAADVQEIDALPDIGGFMDGAAPENSDGDIIKNSDFAEEGTKAEAPSHTSLVGDGDVSKHDTKVIASAIRTLLKKDDA